MSISSGIESFTTLTEGHKETDIPIVLISNHDDKRDEDRRSASTTDQDQGFLRSQRSINLRRSFNTTEERDQIPVIVVGPDHKEIKPDDIAVATDGGWGWVIVFAAFMCNLILDGTVFSFGILQEDIVNCTSSIPSRREPMSKVAWVGSLLFGFNLLSGPFVSAAANMFGFRAVGMTGSIIASLAFAASWLSANHTTCEPNLGVLFIVYGVIGGIGFGLVYVPSIITVGFYFNKRRALATGIAISGSGFGTFVFAPMVKALIKEFQWHGALLIQACFIFSCCAFCALFRPLAPILELDKQESSRPLSAEDMDRKIPADLEFESDEGSSGLPTPESTPLMQRMKYAKDEEKEGWDSVNSLNSSAHREDNDEIARMQEFRKAREARRKEQRERKISTQSLRVDQASHRHQKKRMSVPTFVVRSPAVQQNPIRSNSVRKRDPSVINLKEIQEEAEEESKSHAVPVKSDSTSITMAPPASFEADRRASIRSRRQSNAVTSLMFSNSAFTSTGDMTQSRILRLNDKSVLNKPLYREDIFYAGSVKRMSGLSPSASEGMDIVFTNVELESIERSDTKDGPASESQLVTTSTKFNFGILKTMLDLNLLKSPTFLFLAISGFITLLGYTVPFVYLKGLAVTKRIDENKATFLVSIIGITNTVGRIVCGCIADSPKVNSLIINNGALTIAGIATVAVPLVGEFCGYPAFVAYSCIFGLSMACFASLRSILVVELLGLGKLTNAFGLLLLFQGISAICGSPLGGFLYDMTGSYDITFYAAGSMMLFSGVMCYPLHFINKWENRKQISTFDRIIT